MIDREKFIAQRKKEILKLTQQQARLIVKAAKIIGRPCKKDSTRLKNLLKGMEIAFRASAIGMQIRMIVCQPIPLREFPPGGSQNCQVGEMRHEIIIRK